MIHYSQNETALFNMKRQGFKPDVSIGEGMMAAAEEGFLSGIGAAMYRGAQNLFDTSEEIDWNQANEMYGWAGTSAELKEGEKITREQAQARNDDLFRSNMNEYLQEIVNEDSPFLGRATQFVSGMAGAMLDPAMLALTVTGSAAITTGLSALAKGGKTLNMVNKLAPSAGKMLTNVYGEAATASLTRVVAREGVENFLTSIAEEGVAHAIDSDNKRIATPATATDRLVNVLAGTFLGTGMGTVMNKEGRTALARKWGRQLGDNAENAIKNADQVALIESQTGLPKSEIVEKVTDFEAFTARPWHEAPDYKVDMNRPDGEFYVPVGEDGAVKSVSHRGEGITLTDNKVHAMNSGTKFRSADISELNIFKPQTLEDPSTSAAMSKLIDSALEVIQPEELADALDTVFAKLNGKDKTHVAGTGRSKAGAKAIIADLLETNKVGMEALLDALDDVAAGNNLKFDTTGSLNAVMKELGYDGYRFAGKGADGSTKYVGTHILNQEKLKFSEDFESPKSRGVEDDEAWKSQSASVLEDYARQIEEARTKSSSDVETKAQEPLPSIEKSMDDVMKPKLTPEEAKLEGADVGEVKTSKIEEGTFTGKEEVLEVLVEEVSKTAEEAISKATKRIEAKKKRAATKEGEKRAVSKAESRQIDKAVEGIEKTFEQQFKQLKETMDIVSLTKAERDLVEELQVLDAIKNGETVESLIEEQSTKLRDYVSCLTGRK